MGAPRGLSGAESAGSVRRDPQDWPTQAASEQPSDRLEADPRRLRVV
jgi:hypothetical protein